MASTSVRNLDPRAKFVKFVKVSGLSARCRAETEIHLPQGTGIAFEGSKQFQGVAVIWDILDRVQVKHPDMVLLHGSGEYAELIASK